MRAPRSITSRRSFNARARSPIQFVRIDMEGSSLVDATLRVFTEAYRSSSNVGIVLQAALHRTEDDLRRAIALGARVRLCKGAYREPESVALRAPQLIRKRYLTFASDLLAKGFYPAFATHDPELIAAIAGESKLREIPRDRFEFQMLFGVREDLQVKLLGEGYAVRVYVPFGTHWARYFARRVLERRENAALALRSLFARRSA